MTEDRIGAAALWVARMDSGAWTGEDEAALRHWLAADPARQAMLLRTHASWLSVDRMLGGDEGLASAEPAAPSGWRRRSVIAGVGMTAITALTGSLPLLRGRAATRYATQIGEIRRVPLSDGSVMTMNSGSALAVDMAASARSVALAEGEAWFDVARDTERPFVVAARRVKAQAIGTAFSVRVRDRAVEILVNEGTVKAWSEDAAGRPVLLNAGQRALVGDDAAIALEPERASSVDRALAWRGGMIDLDGMTLGQASAEFNRYNARKIVVTDPALASARIDGVFRVNDPDGFAFAICNILGAAMRTDDRGLIRITT